LPTKCGRCCHECDGDMTQWRRRSGWSVHDCSVRDSAAEAGMPCGKQTADQTRSVCNGCLLDHETWVQCLLRHILDPGLNCFGWYHSGFASYRQLVVSLDNEFYQTISLHVLVSHSSISSEGLWYDRLNLSGHINAVEWR